MGIFGEYYDLTLSEKVIYHVQTQLRYNAGQTWEADRIRKELPEDLEAHHLLTNQGELMSGIFHTG